LYSRVSIARSCCEGIASAFGRVPRDANRLFGRDGSSARVQGSGNRSGHRKAAEKQTNPTYKELPLARASSIESSVGSFPLGAKVGLSIFFAILAAGVWAWGNILFWSSRRGWRTLAGYSAGAAVLFLLSIAAWSWSSPY
jgi:hypothetical protein